MDQRKEFLNDLLDEGANSAKISHNQFEFQHRHDYRVKMRIFCTNGHFIGDEFEVSKELKKIDKTGNDPACPTCGARRPFVYSWELAGDC